MTYRRFLSLAILIATIGCSDRAVAPGFKPEPTLAKGGGPSSQNVNFTITDAGLSLVSDGKGVYQHGVCGTAGSWSDITFLAPAHSKIPKSQQASCAGFAPRTATVTLGVRHLSDNPHIDDAAAPAGSGTFDVGNVKFGWGEAMATTINASGSTPFCGSLGLRYTPVTFPGTSSVARDDLGGGLWHMYTRPYPDNIAHCENNDVAAYWHVSFDLYVQILN